jgi:hypothetical protein
MKESTLKTHFKEKKTLERMIERFGKAETAKRLAWLHDCDERKVGSLVKQFLAGDQPKSGFQPAGQR